MKGHAWCWGFPTGGVLIFAQRRVSTLTQYFTWFGKSPTSTGESHCIRDREKVTINTWRRRITSTQTQLSAHTLCCIWQQLLFLSSSRHFTLCTLTFCSHKYASFIGKHGQHWEANKAIKHATNCGTSGASTCLVVGYCH